MIDGEATLKRFYREEIIVAIRLEARNPEYPSYVIAPEDVTIIGRLIKTVRNYS
jgi:SOS-response transcriptional repressor LexA